MSGFPKELADPNWRINHLYEVINKQGQRVPFFTNNVQAKINQSEEKRKLFLKFRQGGISTNEIIKNLDAAMFTQNMTCCILAHEQDAIKKLFRIARRSYDFLCEKRPDIVPALDRGGGSKYEMFYPSINSRIYCDLEVRGDTVQRLHVSEAAFMRDSSKLKATLQAVPMDGHVAIESTPNGLANYYYDMWIDKDQPYKKFFFPWFIFKEYELPVPADFEPYDEEEMEFIRKAKRLFKVDINKRQMAFRRWKRSELKTSTYDDPGRRVTFEQEYPEDEQTCFLASGEAVLDLFKIQKLIDNLSPAMTKTRDTKLYAKYDRHKTYVCGADVAEGVNRDFSVAVMIEVQSRKVVGVLRGQFKPYDFAVKLNEFCKIFSTSSRGMPLLAVERNNHGHAVLLELNEHIGYTNLYMHSDEKLGWKTDGISRPLMVDTFIKAIEGDHLNIPDDTILNECLTLVDNAGKIEAADTKFDDCVIATSIGLQLALRFNSLSVYENLESKILL